MKTSFLDLERECELLFASSGPYFHLCTDGTRQEIIFPTKDSYRTGMNCVATAFDASNVRILAFVLMSNHVHFILQGSREDCLNFFATFKTKLRKALAAEGKRHTDEGKQLACAERQPVSSGEQFTAEGNHADLNNFVCGEPIPITDLKMLRTEIVYVLRNPYVHRRDMLPHTYPCGTGSLMFNRIGSSAALVPFSSLHYDEKRRILRSRVYAPKTAFLLRNGIIAPESYCAIETAERMFRDASHYYSELNRKVETYSQVAQRLGDAVFMNDEELYITVKSTCRDEFNASDPRALAGKDKLALLKLLKSRYNPGNAQLARMLSIDKSFIDQMYPVAE